MPRPRGADWLEDELRSLSAEGVDLLVSLLTPGEVRELGLAGMGERCAWNGIAYRSFPIADRGVPWSMSATLALVRELRELIAAGRGVAVHCRAGIGRSALLAACLLVLDGRRADAAFERIGAARGCWVPDTEEQREWVKAFADFSRKSPRG